MTIECPRCGTLYRRPPGSAGGEETYRCARCRHVFDTPRDDPAMFAAPAEEPDDDDASRFAFDDGDDDGPDTAVEISPAAAERRPRREARQSLSGMARFAVRAMLLVTLAYAVLSVYVYTHPAALRDALRRVPFLGGRLAETRLHPETVRLTNLLGEYERVQGDRLVFVISGTAVNGSPVPVRGIQVEGRITGAQEQRQVVFCGAAPPDVQDLSLREIALLQTLEPPKDWSLAPGEQARFLVVFATPPTDLREFGAEVVAVQAPGRRGGAA
ncbi:MAG TPA: hypothetical protein VKA21_09435 [Candidatus Binatia bacterium]|nr:hypothetical protein [Candidatus Binatia bacterium]